MGIRRIAAGIVCIAWALWLGGLAALALFAMHLFAVDRALAIRAAPQLFIAFEKYQVVVAAIAMIAAFLWRLGCPTISASSFFLLLAAAALGAGIGPRLFVNPMIQMWQAGNSGTPQFMQMHGRAMLLFSAQTLILVIAGFVLPYALTPPAARKSAV